MGLFGTTFKEFQQNQMSGTRSLEFKDSAPPPSIPMEENPYVDQSIKTAIKTQKFANTAGVSTRLGNLIERANNEEQPIVPFISQAPEVEKSKEYERALSAPLNLFKDIEDKISAGDKSVPFVPPAINPSKDNGIGDMAKLKQQIADKESSGGNYKLLSTTSSATGKYQFLWNTWGAKIMKFSGVKSQQEFLNNPKAQEAFFEHYVNTDLKRDVDSLKNLAHKQGVSTNELARLIHFRGKGGATTLLKKGVETWNEVDSKNNMAPNQYLNRGKWANKK